MPPTFDELMRHDWQLAFEDSGTGDWQSLWFLDGLNACVENTPLGMDFHAGPRANEHADHAVLWTRPSFRAPLRVEYFYTRLDEAIRYVTIIYLLATGQGEPPYTKDIAEWSNLRTTPAMHLYFGHMRTYHLSYAAFGTKNDDPAEDYVRARRYEPDQRSGLDNTDLVPDFHRTGLFATGQEHKVQLIARPTDLHLRIEGPAGQLQHSWDASACGPLTEGRVGLRHMFTRSARYRDLRVYQAARAE